MVLMIPKNYDASNYLYWYRKVDRNPDAATHSLAEAFTGEVASWLGMPPPAIFWFEDADLGPAKQVWLDHPGAKNRPAADPLREPCRYFRWGGPPGLAFCGYTHWELPLGIMINTSRRGKELLETIAEECFHMHQDSRHGSGWRSSARSDVVEGEARAFLVSRAVQIRAFLERWESGPA
jgi:hypothetical protein